MQRNCQSTIHEVHEDGTEEQADSNHSRFPIFKPSRRDQRADILCSTISKHTDRSLAYEIFAGLLDWSHTTSPRRPRLCAERNGNGTTHNLQTNLLRSKRYILVQKYFPILGRPVLVRRKTFSGADWSKSSISAAITRAFRTATRHGLS